MISGPSTWSKEMLVVIPLVVLLLDQASKLFTHLYLPTAYDSPAQYPYGGIPVFESILGVQLSIHHVTNFGAAWGTFAQFQHVLLAIRIAIIGGLCYYALVVNQAPSWRLPLFLIIVGASSNVLDYFLYGHVVDMVHLIFWGYSYPVFNIADSAVCMGVFWLGISMVLTRQQKSSHG